MIWVFLSSLTNIIVPWYSFHFQCYFMKTCWEFLQTSYISLSTFIISYLLLKLGYSAFMIYLSYWVILNLMHKAKHSMIKMSSLFLYNEFVGSKYILAKLCSMINLAENYRLSPLTCLNLWTNSFPIMQRDLMKSKHLVSYSGKKVLGPLRLVVLYFCDLYLSANI